ncbi:glycerophosphodiester phosphodiesterase [Glaciecola siphonariae]|uniref:glycerophosphodiester phosphodiesterase n=1 Tax=Glaciecola siphonariae TaxID=521012 RepID=A0ABV9LTH2_9ALTE
MKLFISTCFLLVLLSFSGVAKAIDIIAHRGASGFLPEHTKEALVLSFMQGADYIEQDLVATKDKQLIVLHDIHLETVTNVEQMFPSRARDDGRFYAIDFSLNELRTLSIHEREHTDNTLVYPNRYNGKAHFTVATFQEHVEVIRQLNRAFGKNVGVYPEIKAPSWHTSQGIDITALFMQALNDLDLNSASANIYVQSFEPEALKRIRFEYKSKVKLVQLIAENDWNESNTDYDLLKTVQGLDKVAQYANGIGPWIPHLIDEKTNTPTDLIKNAQTLGLVVHPYTYRADLYSDKEEAIRAFKRLKALGINGLFTDQVMPYMHNKNSPSP